MPLNGELKAYLLMRIVPAWFLATQRLLRLFLSCNIGPSPREIHFLQEKHTWPQRFQENVIPFS